MGALTNFLGVLFRYETMAGFGSQRAAEAFRDTHSPKNVYGIHMNPAAVETTLEAYDRFVMGSGVQGSPPSIQHCLVVTSPI